MNLDTVTTARTLREQFQTDSHRPRYHFVAPEGHGHPFDPNGAIYWNGRYHLFYLLGSVEEGETSWGHASSRDLLHWRHHPRALVPEGDERDMYSGDAFVTRDGTPAFVYHSVDQGNCIATAEDDDLIEWTKSEHNPVMPNPAWDPAAWREGEVYYSLSGSRPDAEPDELMLYRSTDLLEWERRHPFVEDPEEWDTGADYSCPDFFPLGDEHVLLFISHDRGAQCLIGDYEDERFYPDRHRWMNWPGGTTFAPESLVDDRGRRIFWAWVPETRTGEAQREAGWSGVMSLPRELSLADDGTLLIEPVEELERLRSNRRGERDVDLAAGADYRPDDVEGRYVELSVELDVGGAEAVGLRLCRSPDGEEETLVSYEPAEETLRIDARNASTSESVTNPWPYPGVGPQDEAREPDREVWIQDAPLTLSDGELLDLRVYLDGSILEVFANGRQCVTQRFYPDRDDSTGVVAFARGGDATIGSLDIWDLDSTNPW